MGYRTGSSSEPIYGIMSVNAAVAIMPVPTIVVPRSHPIREFRKSYTERGADATPDATSAATFGMFRVASITSCM